MRSVANLTAYLSPSSLTTVRETVYILGTNYSSPNGGPYYASIVAISLLDDQLHIVAQLFDAGKHSCCFLIRNSAFRIVLFISSSTLTG